MKRHEIEMLVNMFPAGCSRNWRCLALGLWVVLAGPLFDAFAQDLLLGTGDTSEQARLFEVLEGKRMLFHAGFDGTTEGLAQRYKIRSSGWGEKFEKGLVGQALELNRKCYAQYPVDDVLNRRVGTMMLWYFWPTNKVDINNREVLSGSFSLGPLTSTFFHHIQHDGQWHQWAVSWDAASRIRTVYLDGEPKGKTHWESMDDNVITLGRGCPGLIDEFYVFNKVLDPQELRSAMKRVSQGEPAWPAEDRPKPSEYLFPVPVHTLEKERPRLPFGVDWTKGRQPVTVNSCRERIALDGYWRFQPIGHVAGAAMPPSSEGSDTVRHPYLPKASEWLYAGISDNWRGGMIFAVNILDGLGRKVGEYKGIPIHMYPCAWYERDILMPGKEKEKLVVLHVKRPSQDSGVYVNGQYLGVARSGLMNALDMTSAVRMGETNRIQILSGKPYDAFRARTEEGTWAMIDTGVARGVDIEMRKSKLVFQDEPLILPRVREGSLGVMVPVRNNSGQDLDLSLSVSILDYRTEKPVIELGPTALKLSAGYSGTNTFFFPVKGLRYWSPEDPQLYKAAIVIRHSSGTLDESIPESFGYRELWVEKGQIILNGKRILIKGPSHNGLQSGFTEDELKMKKAANMNVDRTYHPTPGAEESLRLTDEYGHMVFYHIRQPLEDVLKRIGNHPSVVAWQFWGNGYVNAPHGHPMQIGKVISEEEMRGEPHYERAKQWRENDPTKRLIFYYRLGTGGDFRGIMTTLGFGTPLQTMEEWPSYWAQTRQDPFVPTEMQIAPLLAHEGACWFDGSQTPIVAEQLARYLGDYPYRKITPELADKLGASSSPTIGDVGEWTAYYDDDWRPFFFSKVLRSWRAYGINGYLFHVSFKINTLSRDMRLTRSGEAIAKGNSPFLCYLGGPETNFVLKDHNYFAGEEVKKSLIFINDTPGDVQGEAVWSVVDSKGSELVGDRKKVAIQQGKIQFLPIAFQCPEVKSRTELQIKAAVNADESKIRMDDTFSLTVFPWPVEGVTRGKIGLIDASGETAAVLDRMKVKYVRVRSLKEMAPDMGLLIIGKNSYPAAVTIFGDKASIGPLVDQGMNVVCLEQRNRHVMGLKLENFNTRYVFILDKTSPLLAGLKSEDFRDWRGESAQLVAYQGIPGGTRYYKHGQANSFGQHRFWHWSNKGMVATFCFEKPRRGNFRVLLENGFDLLYMPLVEFYQGKARMLMSQLDLVDHYGVDPVATLVLNRIIEQYSNRVSRDLATLTYIGGSRGEELLKEIGIDYEKKDKPEGRFVYVDAEIRKEAYPGIADELKSFVEGGGTLIVSIPMPEALVPKKKEEDKPAAPRIDIVPEVDAGLTAVDKQHIGLVLEEAGPKPKAVPSKHTWMLPMAPSLEKKSVFITDPPASDLFSGLGISDFFWREKKDRYCLAGGAKGIVTDSGLIGILPCGKGRIVLIQFTPDEFDKNWQKAKALRIYSTLLTNLGIKSAVALDFCAVGGYGRAEEWLPGASLEDRDQRPVVKASELYDGGALKFDPDEHHVW